VRPGVLLVKASPFWPVRALMRLDFPTLLLPKNAISGSRSEGNAAGLAELTINSACKELNFTENSVQCSLTLANAPVVAAPNGNRDVREIES